MKHKEKEFKREKINPVYKLLFPSWEPWRLGRRTGTKELQNLSRNPSRAGGSPEPAAALCPASRALLQGQHQSEQELGMLCRLSNAHCRGQFCPLLWWLPAPSANRTPGGLHHFSVDLGWGCCALFQPPPWCVQWGSTWFYTAGTAQAGTHITAALGEGERLKLEPGGISHPWKCSGPSWMGL